MHLGEERYRYDPSHYLLATVELPVVSQIAEASPERPSVPEPTTGPRFSTGCLRDAGGRHASPPKGPAAFLFPQILQIVFLHKIARILVYPQRPHHFEGCKPIRDMEHLVGRFILEDTLQGFPDIKIVFDNEHRFHRSKVFSLLGMTGHVLHVLLHQSLVFTKYALEFSRKKR
jgi:hypothetical protein